MRQKQGKIEPYFYHIELESVTGDPGKAAKIRVACFFFQTSFYL